MMGSERFCWYSRGGERFCWGSHGGGLRGSAEALMMVGIYSEIMDGCEGLSPAQWIIAYERGEVRMVL
ncbi:hypothetical protein PRIPAC_97421 [Pristionchus pacificus]|uniref:Uncharacterized protein n=1 Tax=Pristionchus pacificus TaxID=54126 RepID=A0A2A6CV43_PRIPA|nr:hypothetical protein PRIPAC_97421 [Pristionchus pacificus]|eukprot:PDM81913.1 hypothetical protein PRIPAC_34067 [Pristionchus pacificus]